LAQIFQKAKPVFVMTHFNHPKELTLEAKHALETLVDHGVPVLNQMVLLNGINNHPAVVQALARRLLYLRVKPYYVFQCDPSEGTDHLRTSIEESLEIQSELWGNLSGLAMSQLSLDIPEGGGKTTLVPNFEVTSSLDERTYKGWDGIQATYKNPQKENRTLPQDYLNYVDEWNLLKSAKQSTTHASLETKSEAQGNQHDFGI
jgi:lysine 2,3-aminomutase